MITIGVDVSKGELVAVAMNRAAVVQNSWTIQNTKHDIAAWLTLLKECYPHLQMGSEATGEFHNVLAKACLAQHIPFTLLNPIVTKQFTRATVRRKKTDLLDAEVIAKCMLQGEGELLLPSAFNPVKPILRTASRISQIAVGLRHMTSRFRDHHESEVVIHEEISLIYRAMQQAVTRIRAYGNAQVPDHLRDLLMSIPGIGVSLAPLLIAEIEDVERFPDAKALIAFAGLDPRVRQSGTSLKRNTKLTKRGAPSLRRAAFIAASIAQRCDHEFKTYFLKKKGEGKRYTEATVANARHILTRVYAVWKRGTPYQKTLSTA